MRIQAALCASAVLSMCLLAAHAQEPDGDAPAETSADPPPVSDAPVIDMQRYCNRYDVRNRSRYYPNEALRNRVSGQVVLDCVLNDDDTTRSCQVVSEEPQHRGFATASLVMVCRWPVTEARLRQMQVYERDGERRYRRTVEWRTE